MIMPYNLLLCFITTLLYSSHHIPCSYSAAPAAATITLPLTHFLPTPTPSPASSPIQILNSLLSTSLARAKLLKTPSSSSISTPLYTHSYGAYSTSLSLGTPPQTITFLLQTSTDLTWLPCTHKYMCKNCTSSSPPFIPKASSSSTFLPCLNPRCRWFHDTDAPSRCQDCQPESTNCTQICPPYITSSGSGYTGGILLTETLHLTPQNLVHDFIIGCSLFSSHQPAGGGVIGLGRGHASFPNQLRLSKFSYCLLSHKFDDSAKTSNLVLDLGPAQKTPNLSSVQFSRNPQFPNYYYLPLRKITVGGRRVKIPYKYLTPQPADGSGGTIIDSGSAFSSMAPEVFSAVSSELVNQATKTYTRDAQLEMKTGLTPCFNVSGIETMSFPEMSFYFKGGARMALPLANYFSYLGESVCLTLVRDDSGSEGGGPALILGNYQMQNFYAEFDLRNDRFGFKPERC